MVCAGVAADVRFSYDSIISGGWAGDGLLYGGEGGAGERSRVWEEAVERQAKRLERWVGKRDRQATGVEAAAVEETKRRAGGGGGRGRFHRPCCVVCRRSSVMQGGGRGRDTVEGRM
jgi:hypothetical protein